MEDVEILYEKALQRMLEYLPDAKDFKGTFRIECGTLHYSCIGGELPDMDVLQQFINQELGQKEYMGVFKTYGNCYARNEAEAKEHLLQIRSGQPYYPSEIIEIPKLTNRA